MTTPMPPACRRARTEHHPSSRSRVSVTASVTRSWPRGALVVLVVAQLPRSAAARPRPHPAAVNTPTATQPVTAAPSTTPALSAGDAGVRVRHAEPVRVRRHQLTAPSPGIGARMCTPRSGGDWASARPTP